MGDILKDKERSRTSKLDEVCDEAREEIGKMVKGEGLALAFGQDSIFAVDHLLDFVVFCTYKGIRKCRCTVTRFVGGHFAIWRVLLGAVPQQAFGFSA